MRLLLKQTESKVKDKDLTPIPYPTECRQPAINGYFGRMARYAVNERFVV